MKVIILLLFLSCAANGMTQGMISLPEYNVLFKDYDNIVMIGAGSKTELIMLESEQISITKRDSVFILRVTVRDRTADVYVRNTKNNEIIDVLKFRIMNLPEITVSWGIYPDGSEISLDQTSIEVGYDNSFFTEFEVDSYEISSPYFEKTLKIVNGSIIREVIDALKKAKAAAKGKTITFDVVVQAKGKDGIIRKKTATFSY